MQSSPSPLSTGSEIVKAEVISIEFFATSRGERLYALFQTVDKKDIGIWTTIDDSISQLKRGDIVIFRHYEGSKYEFIAKAT